MSKITDIVDDVIAKTNTNTTDIATLETSKLDTVIIHNATSKATPADNDEFALLDSDSTFSLKKLTFANLKATLKTYFDTLYALATVWVANDSRAKTALNASGTAPIYACRAWVNFNGQGTVAIRASGNVSSITDNGAGNYKVNFTTPMPDVNYSGACSASGFDAIHGVQAANLYLFTTTSTSVKVNATNGGGNNTAFYLFDSADVLVSIFR